MQLIEVRGGVHVQQVPVPVPVPAVVERVVSMCCAVGRALVRNCGKTWTVGI